MVIISVREIIKLLVSIIICQMAGLIGSYFTTPAVSTWYAVLDKPFFALPNWIFGPVWITLFFLMGIAAYLVWRRGLEKPEVRSALAVFIVQLILVILWSAFFFGMKSTLGGLMAAAVLFFTVLLTLARFCRVSRPAAWLLVPYLLWAGWAAALIFAIWRLNG